MQYLPSCQPSSVCLISIILDTRIDPLYFVQTLQTLPCITFNAASFASKEQSWKSVIIVKQLSPLKSKKYCQRCEHLCKQKVIDKNGKKMACTNSVRKRCCLSCNACRKLSRWSWGRLGFIFSFIYIVIANKLWCRSFFTKYSSCSNALVVGRAVLLECQNGHW